MEFPIKIDSLLESNLFLRALWAQMRSRFGSIGWQYTPCRSGAAKTITFGFASLGRKHGIEVSIQYERKGSIHALTIEPHPAATSLPDGIELCVEQALDEYKKPRRFWLQTSIELNKPFTFFPYSTSHCTVSPSDPGRAFLTLGVDGFDRKDADFVFLQQVQALLDQLTAWTNCLVKLSTSTEPAQTARTEEEPNSVWFSEDWIDHYPVIDGRLALHPREIVWLDAYLSGKLNVDYRLIGASRHFREALQLLEWDANSGGDTATSLLMSALEVVSLGQDSAPTCKSCGQPIYGISKRVVALAVEHLGPWAERFFKEYYARRSKFLHHGTLLHSMPFISPSQPLLDPDAPEGCATPSAVARPDNLVEFTSFILRRVCIGISP